MKDFESFLTQNIKVENKKGNLGKDITITLDKESVAVAFKDRLSITMVADAVLGAAVVLPEKAIKSTSAGGVAVELPESVKPVAAIPGPLIVTNLVVTL